MGSIGTLFQNFKRNEDAELKYLFLFFKLCGIAPINFCFETVPNSNTNWKFSYSRKNIIYNIILLSSVTIVNIPAFYFYKTVVIVNQNIYFIADFVGFLGFFCTICCFTLRHEEQINILNNIKELRKYVSVRNNSGDRNLITTTKILLTIHMVIWLGVLITISFYNIYHRLINCTINVCHFVLTTALFQYCITVKLIKLLFYDLNNNLLLLMAQTNQVHEIPTELLKLWGYYAKLKTLTRKITNFYSLSMLLILISIFVNLTPLLHHMFEKLIRPNVETRPVYAYAEGFFFALSYLCPYVILSIFAATTRNESKRTREIVKDQLRKSHSQAVKGRLIEFSMYSLGGDIEFTIFDYFTINESLLLSHVGATITYLVVSLQLQQ